MTAKLTTRDAYRLLQDGSQALAAVEANGIRVDVPYLDEAIAKVGGRIKQLEGRLKEDHDVWGLWRRQYGMAANIDSADQLADILFSRMGYTAHGYTRGGRPQATDEALAAVPLPFVRIYQARKKLQKLHGTYLTGVRRHVQDGYLHPFFHLHLVETYRGSSSDPNFQNIPIRDPDIAKWIRRAFVARPGNRIVEIDFSGIEVRVAACYHKDPAMLAYINDPTTDMHRDVAEELFFLEHGNVPRECRQAAKGPFVFAEFYGDFYPKVARNIWNHIERYRLTAPAGLDEIPLFEHLAAHGITALGACNPKQPPAAGTFEGHVKAVEHRFWHERFPVYHHWRRAWFKAYEATGGFTTLTGFRIEGVFSRNEVINYPVQGSAFHCLLWCLIRLQRECRRRGMRALIVGQIHDSIVADVPAAEVDDFVALAREIMLTRLPAAWPWIIVPLEVEAEAAPVGGSWHDKEKLAS